MTTTNTEVKELKSYILSRYYVFVLALLFSSALHAGNASLQLANGDNLTGDILALNGGKLHFDTIALGKVYVDWFMIDTLQAEGDFEIRTSEGERVYGEISAASSAYQLSVKNDQGKRSLDWDSIVSVAPVRSTFEDKLDAKLALGYSYTNAGSVEQTTLNAEITYRDEAGLNIAVGRLVDAQTNESRAQSSMLSATRISWRQQRTWSNSFSTGYESNDELGLDYRLTLGTGLARFLQDTPQARLGIGFGIQAVRERFEGGETDESMEGYFSSTYQTWEALPNGLGFNYRVSIYPGLTEAGRLRADSSASLEWNIIGNLDLDLTVFGVFDNESESGTDWDYGITTGVAISY